MERSQVAQTACHGLSRYPDGPCAPCRHTSHHSACPQSSPCVRSMCPVHTFHAHVHVKSKVSLERVVYTDRLLISGGSTDRILRGVIAVKHGATESTVALSVSLTTPVPRTTIRRLRCTAQPQVTAGRLHGCAVGCYTVHGRCRVSCGVVGCRRVCDGYGVA